MTLDAENSVLGSTNLASIDLAQPLSNSQIAVASTPPFGGVEHEKVFNLFYQVEGDDITMFTGDRSTGMWNSTKLQIPDD